MTFCRGVPGFSLLTLRYKGAKTRHRLFEGSIRAGRVFCLLLPGRCQRNRTYFWISTLFVRKFDNGMPCDLNPEDPIEHTSVVNVREKTELPVVFAVTI